MLVVLLYFDPHQVKGPLRLFAADERVATYIRSATVSIRTAGRAVLSELNEGDALEGEFWFELAFFVDMMWPVLDLLRTADGQLPCMSKFFNGMLKLPEKWDKVCKDKAEAANDIEGEGWKDESVLERRGEMKEMSEKRRKYVHSPMLSTAFALDPEYIDRDVAEIDDGQVLLDMHTMYERLLIDHGDDSKAAIQAAREEEDGGPVARAASQYSLYKTKKWKGSTFLPYARNMSAADWWATYGRIGLSDLAKVALRTTSKIPASAGSERNWSLYGDVMGGRHSRMGPERAKKLVFVRANLRLQSKEFPKRLFMAWDPEAVESDGHLGSGEEPSDDSESESDELVFSD